MNSLIFTALYLTIYYTLKEFFYVGNEIYFETVRVGTVVLILGFLGWKISKQSKRMGLKEALKNLAIENFGVKASAYLFYEAKLLTGLIRFVLSPKQSYQAAMNSYFGSEKLKLILFAIPLLLIMETSVIHLLLSTKFDGATAILLHIFVVISEVYICEILIGSIYYLKISSVEIDNEFLYKVGIMFEVRADFSNIGHIERADRKSGDKTKKLSYFNEELIRITFKNPQEYKNHFMKSKIQVADFYLKPNDLRKLKSRLSVE